MARRFGFSAAAPRWRVRQFSLRSRAQRETHRRSSTLLGLRLNLTAVPTHDDLRGGEPHSVSRKFILTMQARERLEKARRVRHVEARAVVGHAEPGLAGALLRVETNHGLRGVRAELPGVADERA